MKDEKRGQLYLREFINQTIKREVKKVRRAEDLARELWVFHFSSACAYKAESFTVMVFLFVALKKGRTNSS